SVAPRPRGVGPSPCAISALDPPVGRAYLPTSDPKERAPPVKISVDGTTYDFDQSRLMLSEARLIEKSTGMTIPRWQKALDDFNSDALAGLVLLLRRRNGETELQFDDVDFDVASI